MCEVAQQRVQAKDDRQQFRPIGHWGRAAEPEGPEQRKPRHPDLQEEPNHGPPYSSEFGEGPKCQGEDRRIRIVVKPVDVVPCLEAGHRPATGGFVAENLRPPAQEGRLGLRPLPAELGAFLKLLIRGDTHEDQQTDAEDEPEDNAGNEVHPRSLAGESRPAQVQPAF